MQNVECAPSNLNRFHLEQAKLDETALHIYSILQARRILQIDFPGLVVIKQVEEGFCIGSIDLQGVEVRDLSNKINEGPESTPCISSISQDIQLPAH